MKEIKHKAGLELPLSVTSFFRCSYEHSLLIISTSIKPTNETPQVYGALTLFFIEPTGDIPFSDSSLPESVLYIQKKKKKKSKCHLQSIPSLPNAQWFQERKATRLYFPGQISPDGTQSVCSMAAGYIAFSSRAFPALVSGRIHFSFLLLFCSLIQPV